MGSSCLLQPLQAGQPGSHCGRQQVHNRLYNSSDYVYLIWELLYIVYGKQLPSPATTSWTTW